MGISLSIVDIILLICFIPAIIGGISQGLVRQIASLIALLLGIWAGWHFSEVLSNIIKTWFNASSQLINIISFTIIFIVVILLVNLLGKALSKIVKFALLGWLDRLLGVLFAILKYALIFSVIIYLLESLNSIHPFLPQDLTSQSGIYSALKALAPSLYPHLQKISFF